MKLACTVLLYPRGSNRSELISRTCRRDAPSNHVQRIVGKWWASQTESADADFRSSTAGIYDLLLFLPLIPEPKKVGRKFPIIAFSVKPVVDFIICNGRTRSPTQETSSVSSNPQSRFHAFTLTPGQTGHALFVGDVRFDVTEKHPAAIACDPEKKLVSMIIIPLCICGGPCATGNQTSSGHVKARNIVT